MEPLTIEQKRVKTLLEKLTIRPGMVLLDQYDSTIFGEGYNCVEQFGDHVGYVLNNEEPIHNLQLLNKEFTSVRNELKDNLKINNTTSYIESVIKVYSEYEKRITEDEEGNLICDFINFKDCDIDKINQCLFCHYGTFLENLKKSLRAEISTLTSFLKDLNKNSTAENLVKEKFNNRDAVQSFASSGTLLKSFCWTRKDSFHFDILTLYTLLTPNFIPRYTDFADFKNAFSDECLNKRLKIKWLVVGKNGKTSKSSLFHFLSKLEDFHLIDNKPWSKNNTTLHRMISSIFVDKDGNTFSIEGLKSSWNQALTTFCAMQKEIDIIVKTVNDSTHSLP